MKNTIALILITTTLLFSCGENKKEEATNNSSSENNTETEKIQDKKNTVSQWSNGEYFFKGLINFKYAFHMRFMVEDNAITGAYYYDSQKKEIELKGSIVDGNLEVDESFKDKVTGHFSSNVFTGDSISGIWKSPKGIQFSFALFHSKESAYLASMEEGEKNNWTEDELKRFVAQFESAQLPFEYTAISEDEPDVAFFSEDEIKKFAYPEYDPEIDFGYKCIFGKKYETENYLAIIYTEVYYPGAFGINNHSLLMKTFDPTGKLIDEKYLGCHCYDSNYDDYYSTTENFQFTKSSIKITGSETHASHEWIEEESGTKPFEYTNPINRTIKISEEGKFL